MAPRCASQRRTAEATRKTAGIRWMSWLPLVAAISLPLAEGRLDCTCRVRAQKHSVVHIICPSLQNGSAADSCVTAGSDSGLTARRYDSDGFQFLPPRSLVRFSRACQSWHQARNACEAFDATLFVSIDEESVNLLTKSPFKERYVDQYFIGLTDVVSEGIFVDIEGHPAQYLNWSSGEPNDVGGKENCVTLNANGQMNDLGCDVDAPFLCERRLRSAPPPGYTHLPAAGSFVRLSGAGDLRWRAAAAAACAAQGARLFVPDTAAATEALLRHVPVDAGQMLVGLSDAHTEGVFVTDAGDRLSDMEFHEWLPGQPDDGGGGGGAGEDCVALHSHGFLADVSCELPLRYVCEWLP
ncbi:macrophage mannose receptor 1-like isoform X1 [Schistocerca gregaria]|uniref:macrophage mannose receptor 1-like isoform X1 n=1 Tax=Schistocerca gregaria TaxID=7010 RepID=UPI00211DEC1B|nr:macrophage mannose receptor 1-like isoform X1 [Schistocerca gregaria]